MNVIGYDPGFGNTKVCFNGKTTVIQTAVCHPKHIGYAAAGMKTAGDDVTRVSYRDQEFAVGEGAWHLGDMLTSLDYASIVSPERLTALFAALSKIANPADLTGECMLVIGLPIPLMQNETHYSQVRAQLRQIKGEHTFRVNNVPYIVNVARIKDMSQPAGAYMNWFVGDDLKTRPNVKGVEVAIADWGMNSLDEFVVVDGKVIANHVGGAELGMRWLLESVDGLADTFDLMELDNKVRNGQLEIPEPNMNEWIGKYFAHLARKFGSLKRYGSVNPVGGSTLVAGERLKNEFLARGANVFWSNDPVTECAQGLYKFGMRYQ